MLNELMPSKQLRLFAPHRPLVERLGHEVFHRAPDAPGVYTMLGAAREILYIGQSRSLRHRLATYKNAQAGQSPRRIFRLVQKVERILWTVCPSPETAIALETLLIRRHRPVFNRQHTWPPTWFYLGWTAAQNCFALRLVRQPVMREGETLYGAFRGLTHGRHVLSSLARLLWSLDHRPVAPWQWPHAFGRPREHWTWPAAPPPSAPNWAATLDAYLSGTSLDLIELARSRWDLPDTRDKDRADYSGLLVTRQILLGDLETLEDFFAKGPARVAARCQERGRPAAVLPPEEQGFSEKDWGFL